VSEKNRWVDVGDLVIVKVDRDNKKAPWVGLVIRVEEIYGSKTVFLNWTPEDPPGYQRQYGLLRVNIHNNFTNYDVVKKKIKIV
jgi:hypothetical protein